MIFNLIFNLEGYFILQ